MTGGIRSYKKKKKKEVKQNPTSQETNIPRQGTLERRIDKAENKRDLISTCGDLSISSPFLVYETKWDN